MTIRDLTFKLCVFGDGGVGKTTLSRRYLTSDFDATTKITLGMEIHVKYIQLEGFKIALQIWDFGGEARFRYLLSGYSRGSFGGIFMYDITRMNTTVSVEDWLSIFRKSLGQEAAETPVLLVGGKSDLEDQRAVSKEEANRIKNTLNFLEIIECSSKTGENVDSIFEIMVKEILKRRDFI
jgi:small GTP-binding protein